MRGGADGMIPRGSSWLRRVAGVAAKGVGAAAVAAGAAVASASRTDRIVISLVR
jgi:hypothetical protein